MEDPQTILNDVFKDIEIVHPDFDRERYPTAALRLDQAETNYAQSKAGLTPWILSSLKFLAHAVALEVRDPCPKRNSFEDLRIVETRGFLGFLGEHIFTPETFDVKLGPFRIIIGTITTAKDGDFSMLRAPQANLFKSAMENFKRLSQISKVLDYARIIDRHLEIRQLSLVTAPELQVAVNTVQDIISSRSVKLNGTERKELERLIYNAARNHGVLPTSFYVKGVQKLSDHPFGGGSYGDVYKGKMDKNFVAVKVSRFLWDPETKERRFRELCKEALIWRPLYHPNVLPFLGICTEGFPSVGLVSPFMDNGDLLSYIRRNPSIDKVRIMKGVCSGLEHLHNNKPEVIHGDLKCGNILVDKIGSPCIADFGLSRVVDVASLTASTGIKGTLRWQAPELVHPSIYGGDGRVNVKTDMYAYGITCLEIFLEKTPFHDLNDWEVIMMARKGSALDRTIEITGGSHWMHPILERSLSYEAEFRSSAEEIGMSVFLSPLYLRLSAGTTRFP